MKTRSAHGRPALLALTAIALAVSGVAAAPTSASAATLRDDFNGTTLDDGVWTLEHPHETATASVGGGQLRIELPAGPSSDASDDNTAARLMTPVGGSDLVVEAKFDSIPTAKYQDQGLLIRQDDGRWLRFSVYSNGSKLLAYVGSTTGGQTTTIANPVIRTSASSVWLRVTGEGSSWTFEWSPNGSSWSTVATATAAISVTGAGPYAGSTAATSNGTGPAWTAIVDYFALTSDGSAPDPTPTPDPTPDPEPTPTPDPDPTTGAGFVSDDFSSAALDPMWQVVDPIGGAQVAVTGAGTQDARLAISLPAGQTRGAWDSNGSTRILQSVADEDFSVILNFDSLPTQRFQDQGLLVQESASRWLRFSVYSDGGSTIAYMASTSNSDSVKVLSKKITVAGEAYLQVSRSGDIWTFRTSSNGTNWTTIGSSTQQLSVTAVGPYAGVEGPNPAFTALVDFAFNADSPIAPEDGGAPADSTPPSVSVTGVTAGSGAVTVGWSTNELTTGVVQIARTGSSTWTSTTSANPALTHSVTATGLQPQTSYRARIVATDLAGNTTTTSERGFVTLASSGPTIDVWYGNHQTYGANGITQPAVPILGTVSDPDGVVSLTYSLNGGSAKPLTIGPDNRRLQYPGDFNAEVTLAGLNVGNNSLVLTATDQVGDVTQATVTVTRVVEPTLTLPYTLDWSDAPLTDQATVVDGEWTVGANGLRTAPGASGYDRLVAIGELSWTDYEVTVPFTVNAIGPGAGSYLSNEAMVGLALRWQGHLPSSTAQPDSNFRTVGAYAFYRFYDVPKLELWGNGYVRRDWEAMPLTIGEDYIMHGVVDTVSSTTSTYTLTIYPAGGSEADGWTVTYTGAGPSAGSFALIAHHVDATFGDVVIEPR
ncbi:DUF1349 domain-containing protein [Occultella kanbiaonis]|uniref:beta-xylosidase family glycoside hydrolase n=1 Tax=Occultella kanbiaonis TaxID=2675754 RepID=UPI0013D3FCD0|nr:DUF1349 domain-containing protein [Occultella kanbiaonis]